jgi:hypothetical protein
MLQIIELLNAKLNNENESVSFSSHQIWIHHHHVKETKKLQHMVDEKSANNIPPKNPHSISKERRYVPCFFLTRIDDLEKKNTRHPYSNLYKPFCRTKSFPIMCFVYQQGDCDFTKKEPSMNDLVRTCTSGWRKTPAHQSRD